MVSVRSGTGRSFNFQTLFFENGCFLAISEGKARLGAISVSISSSNKASTARVIPSKDDPMFLSTVSEKVASLINGICIVSIHSQKPLDLEDMKAIMEEVMNTIKSTQDNGQKGSR